MEELPLQSKLYTYTTTSGGKKVDKKCALFGMANLKSASGKCVFAEGTVVRGDFAGIKLGKYIIVTANTVLKPPLSNTEKSVSKHSFTKKKLTNLITDYRLSQL